MQEVMITEQQVTLRPARYDEATYILQLEEQCMKEYAVALWGQFRARSGDDLELQNAQIIEFADHRAGSVVASISEDELWIDCLYLQPEFQNKGIGSIVLKRCIGQAKILAVPVRLFVLTTNPALRFYRRHGFTVEIETTERWQLVHPPVA